MCSMVIIRHTIFKDYNILTAIHSCTKEYCHGKVSMTFLNGNSIFEIVCPLWSNAKNYLKCPERSIHSLTDKNWSWWEFKWLFYFSLQPDVY